MTQMTDQSTNSIRGLPAEIDQLTLVSRSSAPVRRAAAPSLESDEPAFEIADLAWIALKVAHCAGVSVGDMRWALFAEQAPRRARRIFYLVSKELTGALSRRLAWYVGRMESDVDGEILIATEEERRQAREIAMALVVERRRAGGDRRAARSSDS
jgi:hypothetical protein